MCRACKTKDVQRWKRTNSIQNMYVVMYYFVQNVYQACAYDEIGFTADMIKTLM